MIIVKRIQFHYGRLKKFLNELENKNHIEERHALSDYLFVLGSAIIILPFSLLLTSSLLYFLDLPISELNLYLAAPLAIILTYIIASNFFEGSSLTIVFLSVLTITICLFVGTSFIASKFIDISYDGQAYHQEAIMQLYRGWNPYFHQIDPTTSNNLDIWLNHYPKGLWILSATIYKLTGNIEAAKGLTMAFTFAAFVLSFSALLLIKRLNSFLSFIISLLAALNPISLYQFLSFYQDGILISILVCFFSIAFKIFHGKKGVKIIPFVAAICLFVNIKLTALPYMVVFLGAYLALMWTHEKVFLAIQMLKVIIFAFILSVCIVGFSPYITNLVYRGNILYPAAGKDAKDYIKNNIPEDLYNDSSPQRLFISIFSRSDNIRGEGTSTHLKMPFTYDQKELEAFRDTNAKEGGFGPIYSGAMIITLLLLAYLYIHILIKWKVKFKYTIYTATFVIFVLFVSAIINPASSLARFVPQIWLINIVILILAFTTKSHLTKILGWILIIVLSFNNYLIAKEYVTYNEEKTAQIESTLNDLANKTQNEPIKVDLNEFSSLQIKLDEHNVHWERVDDSYFCAAKTRFLIHGVAEICKN